MNKKLYVGSLPYSITEAELRDAFAPFGNPESVRIITDKFSGKSKGFGFVEMATEEDAQKALDGMNGKDIGGRTLTVSEAKPEQPRAPRPGGFGGGGGADPGGDRGFRRDEGRRSFGDRAAAPAAGRGRGRSGGGGGRGGQGQGGGGGNRQGGGGGGGGFDDDNFGNR